MSQTDVWNPSYEFGFIAQKMPRQGHQQNNKLYANEVTVQVSVNKVNVRVHVNKVNDKVNDIYFIHSHFVVDSCR